MTENDQHRDQDRRKHPRRIASQPCWCESDEVTLYVKILNVSEGGVFLRTATPFEVGQKCRLVFTCPGTNDEVIAHVEVIHLSVRGRPPGMGLRFVSFEKNGDVFLDALRNTQPEGIMPS